jgi:hypothetical protein
MLTLDPTTRAQIVNSARIAAAGDRRWLNAIDRATRELDGNPFVEALDDHTLLIASPTSGRVYVADGSCQCLAFQKGQPCWHRAMSRIFQRYTESQAHQSSHLTYQQAVAEMDELFA